MKSLEKLSVGILFCACICTSTSRADQPDTNALKTMVQVSSDNATPRRALEIARQTDNDPVLLAAMDNKNPDVRLKAAEVINELPSARAKGVLISLLMKEKLWSNRLIMGSDALTSQDLFISTVRASIAKTFGVNASERDLFDNVRREELITSLKTK